MKLVSFVLAFLITALLGTHPAGALTVEELGAYLGITSWRTVVDLPAGSFTVQIYEFANGVVADSPIIRHETQFSEKPEAGLLLVWGPQDGKYKMMIKYGDGANITVFSKTAVFDSSASEGPPKITEGDYVIFGEPIPGTMPKATDPRTYAQGFLLRIKKS